MDEEIERHGTREDAARLLRATADGVAGGEFAFASENGEIRVTVPESLEISVELEREADAHELEIELEWDENDETTTEDRPPESADQPWRGEGTSGPESPEITPVDGPESLARFELFRDRRDEWRWRLVHRNGNIIATSGEGYTRRANAEKGLKSVVRNAPGADVVEGTDG